MSSKPTQIHYFSYDEEGVQFFPTIGKLLKETPRMEDCYVYEGELDEDNYDRDELLEVCRDVTGIEYLLKENAKLRSEMSCMVDKDHLSRALGYGSLTEQFDWEKAVLGMRRDLEKCEKSYYGLEEYKEKLETDIVGFQTLLKNQGEILKQSATQVEALLLKQSATQVEALQKEIDELKELAEKTSCKAIVFNR